jgi:hypothetical protein
VSEDTAPEMAVVVESSCCLRKVVAGEDCRLDQKQLIHVHLLKQKSHSGPGRREAGGRPPHLHTLAEKSVPFIDFSKVLR